MDDEGDIDARGGAEAADEFLLAPAAILESLPDAVVAATRDGRIVFVNAEAEQLFGYPRAELLGRDVGVLWPGRLRERYRRNMELYFATEHPLRFSTEAWGVRRDGSEFVGEMSWGIADTTTGPVLLAIGRDISERRAAERRLRAVAAMGERALAGADPIRLAAEAVELLRSGLPIAAAQVRLEDGMAIGSEVPPSPAAMHLAIGTTDRLLVVPKRGLTDEEMGFVRAVANTLTTALARLRGEEQIRHDAVHDPLTGLANRTLLSDRLEHALARSEREGGRTGVLFIDLDGFKEVNDLYGHATGDAVLMELGRRLPAAVRPSDTVARLGGDEFVVVCEETDEAAALALGARLQETISPTVTVGDLELTVSASIGVALGREDPETLLANADTAVYRAKAAGRGRVELFR
jgi:diguanylate cyclase (GGDEF)-like protein/PAS domain S-box-containing protein